jgi:hypothetical protein
MKKLAIALVFMSPFVVSTSFAATTPQETVSEGTRVPLLEPTFTSSGQCNGAGQVYCQRERNAKRDLHEHNGRDHARR